MSMITTIPTIIIMTIPGMKKSLIITNTDDERRNILLRFRRVGLYCIRERAGILLCIQPKQISPHGNSDEVTGITSVTTGAI
ncbi:MAG: hypothetical protein BWK80_13655 [Desulfobacteraceae bacterium IS3]|nr:MAG: hypothetical protein BWK80_13655 [Desulfobacteraceae bacterium IS3]